VAFSPDGQLLASGSFDQIIKLWDPATGALKHTLEGHSAYIGSVAFSPDGQLLASGSFDQTIKLWDSTTGALNHTISIDGPITSIKLSKHLPQLITNRGSFNIQVCYKSFSSNPSKVMNEVSLEAGRWIALQGQRELWLPPNYQPSSSTAEDGTIALGCANGRVATIAFSVM
jgi:WD40 repeat protein